MGEQTQKEIRSLTGLRGIAAIYVIMYHFKAYGLFGDTLSPFFVHGYLAVDIFFVLSGFVMALTYTSLFHDGITFAGFKKFMARRVARVYPLYFIITAIFLGIFLLFPQKAPVDVPISVFTIGTNFLMVQAWGLSSSIVGPGWSISTEFGAYILFPIFVALVLFRRLRLSNIVALLCVVIVAVLSYLPTDIIQHGEKRGPLDLWDGRSIAAVIRCICEFTLGLWAYRIYNLIGHTKKMNLEFLGKNNFSIFLWGALIISLTFAGTDILIVCLLPFIIIALNYENNLPSRFLASRPIYFLGMISYSLYLCHLMSLWTKSTAAKIFIQVGIKDPSIAVFLLQIAISITLATIFYYGIEKPGRNLLRKALE